MDENKCLGTFHDPQRHCFWLIERIKYKYELKTLQLNKQTKKYNEITDLRAIPGHGLAIASTPNIVKNGERHD